ncbi:MAG: hypothetical protein Q7S59_02055 [Sulfurimonas sp.]|nr:hypothetical protein [Sulfurimonas sp.]
MEITRYLFQSPYSNQVQIGKPDVVALKGDAELPKSTNEALKNAENFKATQIKEVTPKVDSKEALDIYV